MKIEGITPREDFLIVKKFASDVATDSGFEVEENSDDLLVFAEVVKSGVSEFPPATYVVFHALEAQEFRDGSASYLLIHETDVLGVYNP